MTIYGDSKAVYAKSNFIKHFYNKFIAIENGLEEENKACEEITNIYNAPKFAE